MTSLLLIVAMTGANLSAARAQSITDVIEELLLDYQKLAGMKSTLNQMYNGYGVLTRGYNAVRGVSMDNFNLHKVFLDAQLLVSNGVLNYPRSTDIMRNQGMVLDEYHSASRAFSQNSLLTSAERNFLNNVYDRLTRGSMDNLDELARVTTDSQLRMTDAERLAAIDRLYQQSLDQLSYLRKFNEQIAKTVRQRQKAADNRRAVSSLYQ
jgi:hypothetical protein